MSTHRDQETNRSQQAQKPRKGVMVCQFCSRPKKDCFARQMQDTIVAWHTQQHQGTGTGEDMHRHLTEMAVDAGPEFFRDEAGAPAPWPWRRCPVCVEDIISDLVASPSQDGSSQAYLPMAGEAWQQSWRPRKRQKGVKTCQYCSRKISECFARQMQPTLERRQNELVETAVRNGFGDDAVTDNEIRQDLTELAVDSGPRFFQNESGQSAPWPWRHVPICVEELIDGLVANRREPSDTQEASSEGLAGTDNP